MMMSNQAEVNNNTIVVDDGGMQLAEDEGILPKIKVGARFEIEETGDGKQDGVRDEKVETSCLKISGKVELEETGVGEDGMKTGVVLAGKQGDTDDDTAEMIEEAKEGRPLLENMQVSFMEKIERPSFGGEVREIDVSDDSSTEMNSVVEFSSTVVKTRDEEKEDEVSRLLAALRALCTSANTDVVLLCGAWQMRVHSEVLRARSHALAQMLGTSDGQQARAIVKLRLNMDPGALGIAVNYMYFNEIGNWDGGTPLEKVVEAASELRVPGLLQACVPLLDLVGLVDAFGVLIVSEARGLEELLEAAVGRVNSERAVMLREPMFRERMIQHPAVLLRLYQGVSVEEDHMMEEEERQMEMVTDINSGGVLRACYGCGACSTGLYCPWCDYRPVSR